MKEHSCQDQDLRLLQTALVLAIFLNGNGPTKVVLPLCQEWQGYFGFCATAIRPLSFIRRMFVAAVELRLYAELRLMLLRRQVCSLALEKEPDINRLVNAIRKEQESSQRQLLGKRWSIPALMVIRYAVQSGIRLRDAAWAFRYGDVRFEEGKLVAVKVRPFLAGMLVGLITLTWFGAIAYNMHVIRPEPLADSLLVFGCGAMASMWIGRGVYLDLRKKLNLIQQLVDASRPYVAS